MELDDHLFRRESARLVAALTRVFGVAHLALAEDVAQETLANAFEAWSFGSVPEHYSALLMTAAKNRALDALRRESTARRLAPDLNRFIESQWSLAPSPEQPLDDDELRMMFTLCHPRLAEEAQVALILKILCGFGTGEIAAAFLAGEAAIEKRIARGKKVLAETTRLFELGPEDVAVRLGAVQRALYLLFSEGYHGAGAEAVVRRDLCREAMRLVGFLVGHGAAATPETFALAALMHLDAARLPARLDDAGNLVDLFEQDRTRWDAGLIAEGMRLLDRSAVGTELSGYHVEAAIAAIHAEAATADETRWDEIVKLYDLLLRIRPSPVVALNRAMAVAQSEGAARGLEALEAIEGSERLAGYPFYPAALGELSLRLGRREAAGGHFRDAVALARNPAERRFLEERLSLCYASGNGASGSGTGRLR